MNDHHAQELRLSGHSIHHVREEAADIAPHGFLFSSKMRGGGGLQEARRLPVEPQIERSSSTRRRCKSSMSLKSPPSSSLEEQPSTASKPSSSYYESRGAPDHESSATRPSWEPTKQSDHHEEHHDTALDFVCNDEFVQQQAAILNQIADDKKKIQEVMTGGSKLQSFTTTTNVHHARASSSATSTVKAAAPLVSIENDDNFCLYLQDSEMIREQRMILERIQREQQEAKQPSADPRCCCTRRSSARLVEDLTSRIYESATVIHTSARRGSETSSSTSTEKIRPCEGGIVPSSANNIVTTIGKQILKIKGTSHTYTAIANGTATLVQCMSCKAILQVGSSAKLLYCTNCQHVTPIEIARYNHTFQPSVDQQIARTVQQQELDVACARKLSKIARSRDGR
jgi:hypothetical protein